MVSWQKLKQFKHLIGPGERSAPLPAHYQAILAQAEKEPLEKDFPYRQLVGSLMYAMVGTRPDLAAAVSVVSRFLEKPTATHIKLLNDIWKYIRANDNIRIVYKANCPITLSAYCDASYANDVGYQSRLGYTCLIGNSVITWFSGTRKRKVPEQSAAEAEYYSAASCANEIIWLKQMLNELGFPQNRITAYCDNQAAIALTKNPEFHKRTKHIQVAYHTVREYVKEGEVEFQYCQTKVQPADIFTKGVPGHQLRTHLLKIGLEVGEAVEKGLPPPIPSSGAQYKT